MESRAEKQAAIEENAISSAWTLGGVWRLLGYLFAVLVILVPVALIVGAFNTSDDYEDADLLMGASAAGISFAVMSIFLLTIGRVVELLALLTERIGFLAYSDPGADPEPEVE